MKLSGLFRRGFPILALVAFILTSVPAGAAPWHNRTSFQSDVFLQQWQRTDHETVRTNRTWYWGPEPWFDYYEFYRESSGGTRLVQYFDKARMELNHPRPNSSISDVTNGLLVVEMVGGQLKLGDSPTDNALRDPSRIQVAGDIDIFENSNAPRYASFRNVATINDPNLNRAQQRLGQPVGEIIDREGTISYDAALSGAYAEQTRIVRYISETGHNIPHVFWIFLNQSGPVRVSVEAGARVETQPVIDWVTAMGYPITDPYWVHTKVGGVDRTVLVQLYERRVLTYTPDNPAGYQVEMGNVGQHYFLWRYEHLGQPWVHEPFSLPIVYSYNDGSKRVMTSIREEGKTTTMVRLGSHDIWPTSWRHTYSVYHSQLVYGDATSQDQTRQIHAVGVDQGAWYPITGVESYRSTAGNNTQASMSPDGSKMAFISDRSGRPQLFVSGGANDVQLTNDSCTHESPTWNANGRSLAWAANCDGSYQIYIGELSYTSDRTDRRSSTEAFSWLGVTLVNVEQLTTTGNNRHPRFSPSGNWIAYQSDRDGNLEIYRMRPTGEQTTRLTDSSADDIEASWSYDERLVFSSNRDGDYDLYIIHNDGSGIRQLSNQPGDERSPLWWQ